MERMRMWMQVRALMKRRVIEEEEWDQDFDELYAKP
jgi:hypothetical protein